MRDEMKKTAKFFKTLTTRREKKLIIIDIFKGCVYPAVELAFFI